MVFMTKYSNTQLSVRWYNYDGFWTIIPCPRQGQSLIQKTFFQDEALESMAETLSPLKTAAKPSSEVPVAKPVLTKRESLYSMEYNIYAGTTSS